MIKKPRYDSQQTIEIYNKNYTTHNFNWSNEFQLIGVCKVCSFEYNIFADIELDCNEYLIKKALE